jgi:hypothetical protein
MQSKSEVFANIFFALVLSCALFLSISAVMSLIVTSFSLTAVWWFATVIGFSTILFIEYDLNKVRAKQ